MATRGCEGLDTITRLPTTKDAHDIDPIPV
jgi:hypothetical protein